MEVKSICEAIVSIDKIQLCGVYSSYVNY